MIDRHAVIPETTLDPDTDQLAHIARMLPGVIFQYHRRPDGDGRFTYASDDFQQVLGIAPQQILQATHTLCATLHPEDRAQVLETLEDSARLLEPRQVRYRMQHPQRGWIWIEGRASPEQLSDGSLLWHGVILDITEVMRDIARSQVERAR